MLSIPQTASPNADYAGKRHARLTASMRKLTKAQRLVLFELRYRIRDNETQHISQAALHRATGLSEATISIAMRQLAGETVTVKGDTLPPPGHIFITRTWVEDKGDGRPGYQITMLPPPELRTRAAPAPRTATPESCTLMPEQLSFLGSLDDPTTLNPIQGIQMPETGAEMGSPADPSLLIYTYTDQQQQPRSAAQQLRSDQERPHEIWSDRTWQEMLAGSPGYTRSAFYLDKAKLLGRDASVGLIVNARRNGQEVRSAEELINATRSPRPAGAGAAGQPLERTVGPDDRRRTARPDRGGRAATDGRPGAATPAPTRDPAQPLLRDLPRRELPEKLRQLYRDRGLADPARGGSDQ